MAEPERTFAFGVWLRLTTTDQGGRRTPLAGGSDDNARFKYRPNWGLPQMTPPDQSGALVLAFSRENIAPGEEVRAVIVPPFPAMVSEWSLVQVGDQLPMYEGARVCGLGRILWRRETSLPLPPDDETRFRDWAQGPDDVREPRAWLPITGRSIRQYVRMPDPSEQTYFRAFPILAEVYLEDSWVLDVTSSEDGCVFHLEAVLTPDHPRYQSPRPDEQYCYVSATLTLSSASPVSFHRSERQPATDATGDEDWGNIDTFESVDWEGRHAWSLQGAWGELTIAEPAVHLALAD